MKNITYILKNTKSNFIRKSVEQGLIVMGEKIPGFNGVFVNNKSYAEKIATELKNMYGIKGFISTDELPAYGISEDEKSEICSTFDCNEDDVVVFIIDTEENCVKGLEYITNNAKKYKEQQS